MEPANRMVTPALTDALKMPKPQRLAAFLVLLEPAARGAILQRLDAKELEAVTTEMARLPLISHPVQTEILKEFSELALQASTSVCGGVQQAQAALEQAVGQQRAADLIQRCAPSLTVAALEPVLALPPRTLAGLLQHESPQTIALVIGYLAPENASALVHQLPLELREPTLERLATIAPTPLAVVERIAQLLVEKMAALPAAAGEARPGGVKRTAEVLNALDRESANQFLAKLNDRNPELVEAIRAQMFTFMDLRHLDNGILQRIMREVDLRDLGLALKNADEALKQKLLRCISKRAAESVEEEIAFMGTAKQKDVEAARGRMIEALRRLEADGEVDLAEALQNARHEALA